MNTSRPTVDEVAGVYEFTAANGVPFLALLLRGDYGEFLIAFYDRRYVVGKAPQFTGASYYVSSLLEDEERLSSGLNLHGGVEEWTVDGESMKKLYAWMRSH